MSKNKKKRLKKKQRKQQKILEQELNEIEEIELREIESKNRKDSKDQICIYCRMSICNDTNKTAKVEVLLANENCIIDANANEKPINTVSEDQSTEEVYPADHNNENSGSFLFYFMIISCTMLLL